MRGLLGTVIRGLPCTVRIVIGCLQQPLHAHVNIFPHICQQNSAIAGGRDLLTYNRPRHRLAINEAFNSKIQYLCKRGRIIDREGDIDHVSQCPRQ